MSPGDWASAASAGAAWLALLLAGISLYKNHRSDKRQDELAATTEQLNRLLIERETQAGQDSKRADLSANLITVGQRRLGSSIWRLKVFNRGQGTARNVRLIDLQEGESVLAQNVIRQKFPVPILEQHQWVEVAAIQHLSGPSRAHVKLVWDDDSGENHEKEVTPSF
ncbi:hypothetical protein U8326_10015 [Tsuneonella sp. CC-YZS046]|uniref:hypothetical protein n=1 Tax=Tsuneonella sp. CC-YZS046 TaxID=3042152 RepID=UPI002D779104|nr:hypothetical protein [Tsuneonella sp. CC-YZS046]WRO65396.1 hypothetical protein U8326_10015 [Tsuneonella sp. CC-YZS046]